MTPRESLEAAGWKPWNRRGWWESPDGNSLLLEPEALAQLARDEAKETSDDETRDDLRSGNCVGGNSANNGGTAAPIERTPSSPDKLLHYNAVTPNTSQAKEANDGRVDGDAHQVADKADQSSMLAGRDIGNRTASAHNMAPVATSVSAPESAEQFYAKSAFNFVWYRSNGDIFEFAEAYALEYASSSSATLLAANEVIRRQLKKVCDQAGAAEVKVAELSQQIREDIELQKSLAQSKSPCGHLAQFSYTEDGGKTIECLVCVRDSRDRLQEALMAAANHLHYVGQEQAAGQARKALGDPPEGNQHG